MICYECDEFIEDEWAGKYIEGAWICEDCIWSENICTNCGHRAPTKDHLMMNGCVMCE